MQKNRKKNKFGFTLIEIVVVVSSIGIIMIIVVGTILQTMKAQNRNRAISKLSDEGNWILSELRRNVFNSGGGLLCSSDNLSVGLTSVVDNLSTVLSCSVNGNKIASSSGSIEKKLNSDSVTINNCDNFVFCGDGTGDELRVVTFKFSLSTLVSGVGTTQDFWTTVVGRN